MIRPLAILALLIVGWALAATPEEEWVHRRVREIRGSDTDTWRQIPWTATLLDAARASAAESRPMFVFTHDGNIDTGRC